MTEVFEQGKYNSTYITFQGCRVLRYNVRPGFDRKTGSCGRRPTYQSIGRELSPETALRFFLVNQTERKI